MIQGIDSGLVEKNSAVFRVVSLGGECVFSWLFPAAGEVPSRIRFVLATRDFVNCWDIAVRRGDGTMGRERPLSTNDPNLKTAKSRDDDTIDFVISDETKAHIYGPARVPLKLDWAAVSDIGKLREHNEDHYLVFQRRKDQAVLDTNLPHGSLANSTEDVYVFAVADGLGGHSHGELASAMVLQSGVSGKEGSWLMQLADLDIAEVIPHATAAAEAVHRRLLDEAYRDAKLRGMASTLTAAVVFGHQVVLLHLGDSRAYRFHDGELTQVTRDHTLAQDMAQRPDRTADLAAGQRPDELPRRR